MAGEAKHFERNGEAGDPVWLGDGGLELREDRAVPGQGDAPLVADLAFLEEAGQDERIDGECDVGLREPGPSREVGST